ncbi:hypothetical protein BDQ17DRAFT_1363090 [Cyathus striatus]|nr:hypothetical protein BDQ17DRAFT_1363090 [Cyathus striatus]
MPSTLIVALKHAQIFRFINISSIVVLIYDYLLTLELEISEIWSSKWNLMKCIFLVTRYLPLVDSALIFYHHFAPRLSEEACRAAYKGNAWLLIFGGCFAEIILTLRTLAVWGNKQNLCIILYAFFVGIWTAAAVLIAVFLKTITFAPYQDTGIPGCVDTGGSHILSAVWILIMVYDAVTLGLMTVRGLDAFRPKYVKMQTHLINAVHRDGIIYYFYLFVLSLVNVILSFTLPADFISFLAMYQRVLHSVLSCRAILHIREQSKICDSNLYLDVMSSSS